jgi:hypothetical protein
MAGRNDRTREPDQSVISTVDFLAKAGIPRTFSEPAFGPEGYVAEPPSFHSRSCGERRQLLSPF